jgi:hypothetical protein
MVDAFTTSTLMQLLSVNETCVSIYMPTVDQGSPGLQNRILFKDLLRQARERLAQAGCSDAEAERILEPASELIGEMPFWLSQEHGLVLLCSGSYFHSFRLPVEFPRRVVVNQRFHITPLLVSPETTRLYHVVCLSHEGVQLYRGSWAGLEKVEAEGIPSSIPEALGIDISSKWLERRPRINTATGSHPGHPGTYHGGDKWRTREDEHKRRYIEIIDGMLDRYLADRTAAIVLCGHPEMVSLFTKETTKTNVVGRLELVSPEALPRPELHRRTLELVATITSRQRDVALGRYRDLSGHPQRATADPSRIVTAAMQGRIAELLFAGESRWWGHFDPARQQAYLHSEPHPGDDDLLDLAVGRALLDKGAVYALPHERLPRAADAAAILRY